MKKWLFGREFSVFEVIGVIVACGIPNAWTSSFVFIGWMLLGWALCTLLDIEY